MNKIKHSLSIITFISFSFFYANSEELNTLKPNNSDDFLLAYSDIFTSDTLTSLSSLSTPSEISITIISLKNISCNGHHTGWIKIETTGGTGNYTYNWAHTEEDTNSVDKLSGGEYFVTVTDSEGNHADTSIVLTEPEPLEVEINVLQNIICDGDNNGTIEAIISGGTEDYDILWNRLGTNPQSFYTDTIENLIEGAYEVYITDANQCHAFADILLAPTNKIQVLSRNPNVFRGETPIHLNGYHIPCYGGTLDSTTIIGKNNEYAYKLIYPDGYEYNFEGKFHTVKDLPAGKYDLIATDENNCQSVDTFELLQPDPIIIGQVDTSFYQGGFNVTCYDKTDGYIRLSNITGGHYNTVNPYEFFWSTPDGHGIVQNEENQNSLKAGTYYLTVLDKYDCFANDTFVLKQPDEFNVQAEIKSYSGGFNISCFGKSDGEIEVDVDGGYVPSGSYKYSWSNGANTTNIIGLSANTYSLTVEDDILCETIKSFDIVQPPRLNIDYKLSDYSGFNISCKNEQDGKIELLPVDGYVYKWEVLSETNISSDTSKIQMDLGAGIYKVKVKDANNCIDSATIQLTEPEDFIINGIDTFNITSIGAADGKIIVELTGGSIPYNYMINSDNTQSDSVFSNLDAGKYKIIVNDANNCGPIYTDSIEIVEPTIGITNYWEENTISYYPNPADEKISIEINNINKTSVDLKIVNSIGSLLLNERIETPNKQNILELRTGHLNQGIYFILIDNIRLKTPLIIK